MEDSTIKTIKIIKRPRKVKLILKKLQYPKKKSNDIKTIIIKPHQVVKGDHKYHSKKKIVGGKPRKKNKTKNKTKINKKIKVKKDKKKKKKKKRNKEKK